jgi:hypothetical protein
MRRLLAAIAVSCAVATSWCFQPAPARAATAAAVTISPNRANDLPTYPALTAGDNFPLHALPGAPAGKNSPCTWYESYTRDKSADVVAWYRHALKGATEKTIVWDHVNGKGVPAVDFAVGINHVSIVDWNSDISNTRIQIWSSPENRCKVPGM